MNNGVVWHDLFSHLIRYDSNLTNIFSPFIKIEALKALIDKIEFRQLTIIGRFRVEDIKNGFCDLESYLFLKEKGVKLFINNQLHSKLYIFEDSNAYIGSSNLTASGLGIGNKTNLEASCLVSLNEDDWCNIFAIINSCIEFNDDIYNKFNLYIQQNLDSEFSEEVLLNLDITKKYSSLDLPSIESPEVFFQIMENKNSYSQETLIKYYKDCYIFGIFKINERKLLESKFKANLLIAKFLEVLKNKGYMRFGEVTDFFHNNISDRPLPFRSDIKEKVNILYNWLSYYFDEVSWKIPGARSQVIYWKDKSE